MDKIKFEDSNILDRLYFDDHKKDLISLYDDFFKLPLNPEYEKNQLKKQQDAINELLEISISEKKNVSIKVNNELRQQ